MLSDVFGGAQGVLGIEGTGRQAHLRGLHPRSTRHHRSHGERARRDFTTVPLQDRSRPAGRGRAWSARYVPRPSSTPARRGPSVTSALRDALMRHPPRNAARRTSSASRSMCKAATSCRPRTSTSATVTVHGVHITFGDMYLFQHWGMTDEPALTLGMDLLGLLRRADHRLRPPRAADPPAHGGADSVAERRYCPHIEVERSGATL